MKHNAITLYQLYALTICACTEHDKLYAIFRALSHSCHSLDVVTKMEPWIGQTFLW